MMSIDDRILAIGGPAIVSAQKQYMLSYVDKSDRVRANHVENCYTCGGLNKGGNSKGGLSKGGNSEGGNSKGRFSKSGLIK